jgi:hypothetical protein
MALVIRGTAFMAQVSSSTYNAITYPSLPEHLADSAESAMRELNLVFEGFEVAAWLEYEQERRQIGQS